jgi:cellulose synthase/poly-beta-1,6-N-acetylglucosamine synthase-like glycosyltransferase
MLVAAGVICLAILALLLSWQLVWAWRFARQFPAQPVLANDVEELPRVVVLLPIRGADPSLADCLQGLLNQDYPHYDLRIIIDSVEDPAWNLVHQILARDGGTDLIFVEDYGTHFQSVLHNRCVQVSPLKTRRKTCGLKSSALLQAIGTLDESCEVVALIDADVVPYRRWLRDLVRPLTNPEVGATTGIRWFMPQTAATWGSLVRYLWNAAAVVQMHALHIPWGGSLALRAQLLGIGRLSDPTHRRSDLLEKWGVSLWEDTASYRSICDVGLKLAFVPAATMVNRETTDLKGCFRFIRRQMLNVRLYHASWLTILVHGVVSCLALSAALVFAAIAAAAGERATTALLLAGPALYGAGLGIGLLWLERRIGSLVRARGETSGRPSMRALLVLKALLALPLTHLVYFACLASASMLGKVSWRGITYEFEGPWTVRMRRYRPYRTKKTTDQGASVI